MSTGIFFTYRCFDINNIEKLVYTIDWDNFEFKCNDMSSKMLETSTFRSKNLYDIADKDGFLDYK